MIVRRSALFEQVTTRLQRTKKKDLTDKHKRNYKNDPQKKLRLGTDSKKNKK